MSNQQSNRLGRTYLEGVTVAENPENRMEQEWTGKLQTKEGRAQFRLYYNGGPMDDLFVVTDYAPQLIVAEDPADGARYLLFDGCKHGYNALN